ncbi:uncharacterized protein F5891DRAFT_982673 [Suillus fuscotomentosus]|uniref:DUF6532 domain-containing protein n=1 Tax=Suillus fuscotomentosus TaxID=1912939 RepID=A0AAD4E1F7_9AGAM|nr:uncharacterized protein F5891DRAFT_982673 [Suillus fuscotomentosus]KAG1897496.1 hypothetical protein F5891DRAFT_982673 [Suillus fuscotomentosus]
MDLTDNPINHDVDNSDVFTSGEIYYGEGNNYEDLHHLKHVWPPPSDDEGDNTESKGRVAVHDYEVAVQQLIKFAISHFCVWLASEYAYPDCMTQVLWAKEAWKEACNSYEFEMGFNGEIIQMITRRTSHLTSEVKGKVRPLVENIYGFESTNLESIKCRNRKLAHELKDKFELCYRDLGDKKNNVPHSGLFQSRTMKGLYLRKFFHHFQFLLGLGVHHNGDIVGCKLNAALMNDISFSSGDYREVYDKHLTNLKKFHTQTKVHGILDGILTELNNNGRLHAKVDPINIGDGDCLSDNKINNAIREYQQVGGADDSDKVESDLESEGGQFEVGERVE